MDTKTCPICKREVEVAGFYLRNGRINDPRCKECILRINRERRAANHKPKTHKICTMCNQNLPRSPEFYSPIIRHGIQTGWQGKCKACVVKNVSEWRKKNPELFREQRKAELVKAKLARSIDPTKFRQQDRKCDLKRHYGLTVEQYEARLAKQNGVCGICEEPCNSGRRLAVDHNHKCCPGKKSCGKCVRGLLCGRCNHALERFDEVVDYVARVQRYLSEFAGGETWQDQK